MPSLLLGNVGVETVCVRTVRFIARRRRRQIAAALFCPYFFALVNFRKYKAFPGCLRLIKKRETRDLRRQASRAAAAS